MFTIVMIIGIDGAMYAVEKLFELDIQGKRYAQINLLIVGLFSVGYFLSQITSKPLALKQNFQISNVEKFFTKWVLTPLSLIYFIILYVYTFKVLVTLEWPKGILAWLIVYFSLFAILTYLFWTHFSKEERGKWRRLIWLAVFFQTFMLFAAIGMRISEYSWTEDRYMIFILGVWLFGISVYFLLQKDAKIKWIFVSLSLIILFSQTGPFSAYQVSKNAQVKRLEVFLERLKTFDKKEEAPIKIRFEISNIIDYLYRSQGVAVLKDMFPKQVKEFLILMEKREERERQINKKQNKTGLMLRKWTVKHKNFTEKQTILQCI
ncbi:MAG: DUF4153 domain-containing protein [Campylobacterales bacterium]|nr:DUF4153 domain-containing protein [Campylobacterales bacterium]